MLRIPGFILGFVSPGFIPAQDFKLVYSAAGQLCDPRIVGAAALISWYKWDY